MPPKTAMRFMSSIPLQARSFGAKRPELIAGVARLMLDRERPLRLGQGRAEPGVGRLDQDRADADAALGNDSAMAAHEQVLVVAGHHLGRDAFVGVVTALPFGLGADAQRRQNLDARPGVALLLQQLDEAAEELAVVLLVVGARQDR